MQKPKTVLIHTNAIIRDIEPSFMRYLKNKIGYYIIFIVATKEDINFYKNKYKDSFDEIICSQEEFEFISKNYKDDDLLSEALKIEERFDSSLGRLFLSDRTIGRGYHASGGYNHPKTRLHQNSNYLDIIKIAVSQVNFWEKLFSKNNIIMSIDLPNVGHLISLKKNIHAYRLYDAKFEKRQFWTSNLFQQPDNIKSLYDSIIKKDNDEVNINLPHHSHMTIRKVHLNDFKFFSTLRFSIIQYLRRTYGRIKGYRKGKNIYAFDEFKYIWRRRKDFHNLRKISTVNHGQLKQKKYIYFPLVTEPEIALHGIAHDFFFQLSALNMIARDLPADHIIIVKEHLFAMGRRPYDFYKQILELKNVFIADPIDLGLNYIKHSQAVACITGTAGWEAAAIGIPVISFSKNNCYNFLEHVFYINNADDTKKALNDICKNIWPSTQSKKSGAAFYASSIKDSFDILNKDAFISWNNKPDIKNEKNIIEELAIILYNQLQLKINDVK